MLESPDIVDGMEIISQLQLVEVYALYSGNLIQPLVDTQMFRYLASASPN